MFGLDPSLTALLILCLFLAFVFEFINGFHDTANAVATVIYTNSLKPWVAVVWSGIWNSIGVLVGGIAVAMSITNLLPVEILTDSSISHNIALILSLLLTSILWNLLTWYYGIPCSSSHTLVGSILGVGMAYGIIAENPGLQYVNWGKAGDIGLSLLFSPLIGFSLAIILMFVLKQMIKNKAIFKEPKSNRPPPLWIRTISVLTCTGISFSHGSNDGQKGVGLIMLIMVAIVPTHFAINHATDLNAYKNSINEIQAIYRTVEADKLSKADFIEFNTINSLVTDVENKIANCNSLMEISDTAQLGLRQDIILISKANKKLVESDDFPLSTREKKLLKEHMTTLKSLIEYAPFWVVGLIALALGTGTMIGWKRIVRTIGEKIGKQHLTYAQGMSSELVAATTISLSTMVGLPVSTTQVLSSGVAGSMVASKGIKNLRGKTVKTIFIAWLLTFPVTVVLSGGLFLLFRAIF